MSCPPYVHVGYSIGVLRYQAIAGLEHDSGSVAGDVWDEADLVEDLVGAGLTGIRKLRVGFGRRAAWIARNAHKGFCLGRGVAVDLHMPRVLVGAQLRTRAKDEDGAVRGGA